MHPLVIAASIALIVVNGFLLYHAARHFERYTSGRTWPRIEVRADSVDVQRVIHSRERASTSQHYEAIFSYRYNVQGRDYTKQTVVPVGDRAEAERLKSQSTLSFLYNPSNPAETLREPPGRSPLVLTLVGILVVNSMGLGLIFNLASFFGQE